MKAMLSQPMAGKTQGEIVATREKAIAALKEQGYEVVNTLFTDEWYSNESMKERGWEKTRGCRIEHEAACAYGLTVIYEDGYNILDKEQEDKNNG